MITFIIIFAVVYLLLRSLGGGIVSKLKEYQRWAEQNRNEPAKIAKQNLSTEDKVERIRTFRKQAQAKRGEFLDWARDKGMFNSPKLKEMVDVVNAEYRQIELDCMHLLGDLRNQA